MNLYEINAELQNILNSVDPETGEITDEQLAALSEITLARDEKIDNIACYIKSLKAEAEALKAEKQALAERQSQKERHAERWRDWLAMIMNGEKFESPRSKISWRKSTSVNVFDDREVPEEYWKIKREVSKSDISAALKAGTHVPGAVLEEKMNMQVK